MVLHRDFSVEQLNNIHVLILDSSRSVRYSATPEIFHQLGVCNIILECQEMSNPSTSTPTPSNILLINITKFASEESRDIVRLLGLQVQTLIHSKLGKMSEMI